MKLAKTIKYDVLFQFRHGFYYAYLLVIVMYIALLRSLSMDVREKVAVLLVFSDTSVLGFFFIGGIVLLEKGQKTLENLFVTPLRIGYYFASKTISLTMLAILMSLVIMTASFGTSFYPVPVLIAVILGSTLYTMFGFAISTRMKSVNSYLLIASLCMVAFFLPILEYMDIFSTPLFYLFPGKAAFVLLDAAFTPAAPAELIYGIFSLAAWAILAYMLAKKWFYEYILLKIGEG